MHLNGKTINLVNGDYTATIVTMGGGVASLRYKGQDIVYPFSPEHLPPLHQGKVLAPFPNRIIDGRYTFKDHEYQLPINDVDNSCALHGLVAWQEWDIVDMWEHELVLENIIPPRHGYPFLIKIQAHYELIDGMGMRIEFKATNLAEEEAPFGIGMHTFITCNRQPINECKLHFPCDHVFATDDRNRPINKVPVAELGYDFNQPREIGDINFNNCFLAPNEGRLSTVALEYKRLFVFMKTSAPYIQLYTPEIFKRQALGAEPMSCAPDAFNNGLGLVSLQQHQYFSLNFMIGALEK